MKHSDIQLTGYAKWSRILGDEWVLHILRLMKGTPSIQFSSLIRSLNIQIDTSISPKTFINRMVLLEREGLVSSEKVIHEGVFRPSEVYYSLTDLGNEVLNVVNAIEALP